MLIPENKCKYCLKVFDLENYFYVRDSFNKEHLIGICDCNFAPKGKRQFVPHVGKLPIKILLTKKEKKKLIQEKQQSLF